jgi:hypothetical protein
VKGIAVDILGILALAMLTMVVGTGLIQSFSMDVSRTLPAQMTRAVEDIVNAVFLRVEYTVCDSMAGQKIKYGEFKTLLSSMLGGTCNQTTVQIDFSLTEKDLERIAGEVGSSGVLFINRTEPVGAGMMLVRGNPGLYPLKYDDTLNLTAAGKPKKDVMILVTVQGCDPYDGICQLSCSFKKGVCDPYCYRAGQHEDVPCDLDCVDTDGDGIITGTDKDGVCDRDCYNTVKDPGRAYDPDCVPATADDICDPDTNGAGDGVCDPDCFQSRDICDPDCVDDPACVCDGGCNGYCSISCKDELIYPENDPDCLRDERGTACCGDGICGFTEDCQKCGDDCPPAGGCGGIGKVCCPQDALRDEFGCTQNLDIGEGGPCSCDSQCSPDLRCSPGEIPGKYCCPRGKKWDGQKCKLEADVLIVALRKNMLDVYSDSQMLSLERKIDEYQEALSADSLTSLFICLDTKETSDIIGSKVEDASKTSQIQAVLEQLIPKLKAKYLVILGGYSRFPQFNVGTGSCPDPLYGRFQTDDFYADFNPKDGLPDIPIGRIPDPGSGDMQALLAAMNTFIELHRGGGLDLSNYRSVMMRDSWSTVCANLGVFGRKCEEDDRCTFTGSPADSNGRGVFLLLVHGSNTNPQQFDQGANFNLFSTGVPELNPKGSLWMMCPCYSSILDNKHTSSNSIPIMFFRGGGAIYLGGTRTQMGGTFGRSTENDCEDGGDYYIGALYTAFAKQLTPGKRIGDAYLEGKVAYSHEKDPLSCNYRQLHENLIYGDPSLKIKRLWHETD